MNGYSMQKKSRLIVIFSVILLATTLFVSCTNTTETAKHQYSRDGDKTVRVGCLVSEEYFFYTEQLFYMSDSLSDSGYLSAFDIDLDKTDAKTVWKKICSNDTADNFRFESDSFYYFDTMDDGQKDSLLKSENVDLMLVFGTSAGVWLTQNADVIDYEYMVFGSADPISAGIVKDQNQRFNNKSFAHVDPGRIKRQLEFAYEISEFKSIGVVYEDSKAAYSYSGIGIVEELSKKYGFEIHRVNVDEPKSKDDYDRYYRELKAAYHSMLNDIDVLYITTGMIEDEKLPWLLSEVHKKKIITVAETSESQVEYGAMMHITMSDPKEEGQFAGQTLQEYFSGTPINKLNQVFMISPHIALNKTTIEKVGADVPMSVYLIADSIFQGEKHEE